MLLVVSILVGVSGTVSGRYNIWQQLASFFHRAKLPQRRVIGRPLKMIAPQPQTRNKKLLGAPGIATRSILPTSNKKLPGAAGIATRSILTTSNKKLLGAPGIATRSILTTIVTRSY